MIKITDLVRISGGQIVGKIRLQKIVYLLDKLGLDSGFSYSYHHYGPYSSELFDEADWEIITEDLEEIHKNRVSDGVPYVIFRPKTRAEKPSGKISGLEADIIERYTTILNNYTSTELELAATAYWISKEEEIEDWRPELKKRKGVKTEGGRTEKALEILERVGLSI